MCGKYKEYSGAGWWEQLLQASRSAGLHFPQLRERCPVQSCEIKIKTNLSKYNGLSGRYSMSMIIK